MLPITPADNLGSFIFIKYNVEMLWVFLVLFIDRIICKTKDNFHHSRRLKLGSNDCRTLQVRCYGEAITTEVKYFKKIPRHNQNSVFGDVK